MKKCCDIGETSDPVISAVKIYQKLRELRIHITQKKLRQRVVCQSRLSKSIKILVPLVSPKLLCMI